MRTSQMFLAIDVARFHGAGRFEKRMRSLVEMVKSSRAAKGFDEVLVAGEPEWRVEEQRRRDGIPVSEEPGKIWCRPRRSWASRVPA